MEKSSEKSAEEDKDEDGASKEAKISESAPFKEETNKADELINPEKKALDEFKVLIQEVLNKREFFAPPPPLQAGHHKFAVYLRFTVADPRTRSRLRLLPTTTRSSVFARDKRELNDERESLERDNRKKR
ncbi:patellin-3 [Striga asiatica]|uniref:Patellin-3 n=1 Tax=Striga asiatica TaxID=4170 RepID=A0A5A7PYM6_STRAF|nr:patellin-3 [Striga asiatica]